MIIFLHGPDTFRSRCKLNEIIKEHKTNYVRFLDGKKDTLEDLKNEAGTISMFKEKKLVVLTNSFLNTETEQDFLGFLKNNNDSEDMLLFYEEKVDSRKPFFKFLKKQTSYEFNLLEGVNLKNWAEKEFKKYNAEIEPSALASLLSFLGNNLWELSNEIKKLSLYKKGSIISSKDVFLLVKPKIEPAIFETIDAIAQQNKKKAINLVHQHLEEGDSPFYLFSMIKLQISNLLTVKDFVERGKSFPEIIKKSGLHPFVVRKSYGLCQKFDLGQLKNIYRKIFKLEIKIKTGKIDPDLALDVLVLEV